MNRKKEKIISVRLDEQTLKQIDAAVESCNAKGSNVNRCHLIRLALQSYLQKGKAR